MKAQIAFKSVNFFVRLFFLIIVVLSAVALIRSSFDNSVDTIDADTSVLFYNILYNRDLMKVDPYTGRIAPGIFDNEKFSKENVSAILDKSISFGQENNHIAARISLFEPDLKNPNSIYYNPGDQQGYDEWIILANSYLKGPGGADKRRYRQYVLLDDQKKIVEVNTVTRRS